MILPDEESWGDGDRGSKVLGCYEINLHQVLLTAVGRKPSVVVNVGCAEGYYAVGLGRLLPEVTVHAFDIDERAQAACRKGAERNGVASRTNVAGLCDVGKLQEILNPAGRKLIVMDCEGAEGELIDPVLVAGLASCDLIVETHDFVAPGITDSLKERLRDTHDIEQITQGGRDANSCPQMNDWPELERYLMLSESRPANMQWLACWSRQPSTPGPATSRQPS
jgi:ribosomal protein L11 methylase PrmA